jgi:predicted component of type VI protein secretion system
MPDNPSSSAGDESSSNPDDSGSNHDTRTGGSLNDYARMAREKWESEQAERSDADATRDASDKPPSAEPDVSAADESPASDAVASSKQTAILSNEPDSNPADAPEPSEPEDTSSENSEIRMGSTTHDLKKEAARALHMQFEKEQAEKEKQQRASMASSATDDNQVNSMPVVIQLTINEQDMPLKLTVKSEMIVGRGDVRTGYRPDVDLTPYGAYRLGISRRHARLTWQNSQLCLVDSGSRNGTAINGHVLPPDEAHPLHDGDVLRFGNLSMTLHFPVNDT